MADMPINKQFTLAGFGRWFGIIGIVNAIALLPDQGAEKEDAVKENQSEQSISADGQPISKGKTVRIRVASTNNKGKSINHEDTNKKDLSSCGKEKENPTAGHSTGALRNVKSDGGV